ncbi:MAG: lipoate--protein ligase, partial [Desulfobacteraceae bacterium]|nr:lipoate--protein ligase [Desulfobacteraceae bacterium]
MRNGVQNWRLLDTGKRTAAENMCLDETILEARGKGVVPNTFRFLQFQPHCCLVGFHQSVEQEIREDYCTRKRIHINRRITGGGTIYFGED